MLPDPATRRGTQRLIHWVAENATPHYVIEARRFYTNTPDHARAWLIWSPDRIEMARQGFARTEPLTWVRLSLPEFHAVIRAGLHQQRERYRVALESALADRLDASDGLLTVRHPSVFRADFYSAGQPVCTVEANGHVSLRAYQPPEARGQAPAWQERYLTRFHSFAHFEQWAARQVEATRQRRAEAARFLRDLDMLFGLHADQQVWTGGGTGEFNIRAGNIGVARIDLGSDGLRMTNARNDKLPVTWRREYTFYPKGQQWLAGLLRTRARWHNARVRRAAARTARAKKVCEAGV